jgi:Reverse transcriptase (RNA-dependent DNA polymerase)
MGCLLDPKLPARKFWKNLDTIGAKDNPSGGSSALQRRRPMNDFSFSNTHDLEVFNAMNQIKSNAIGMEEIPIKFVRLILPQILSHITHIFNTILTSSCFPATWKISKILLLAKKSNPSALSDYRPISILPALSKALEVIMKRQITQYVDTNGLLNKFQSGYRRQHSTATALLKIQNDISKASDAKLISFLVLLDFSKAFDSVNHELLCEKLKLQFGFTSSTISMIKSYLAERTQCVYVDGSTSTHSKIHVADFTFTVRRINENRHTLSAYVFLR